MGDYLAKKQVVEWSSLVVSQLIGWATARVWRTRGIGLLQTSSRPPPRTRQENVQRVVYDPKSARLPWFSHPQIWGTVMGGSIGSRILNLVRGSGKTIDPAK